MKIFDCFLFFNELEILELRLMTLNEVVNYFVIVEANKTFTGNKKGFLFEKNRKRYKDYLDKIIYVKVEDVPVMDTTKDFWTIEHFQRNCICRGLVNVENEDRIIISDVDEIPNPKVILQVKDSRQPITFNQYLFYYYVNCMSNRGWNGSIIVPFKDMLSPQEMRKMARRKINKIDKSGWHYSYMGGLDNIVIKLNNLADAHTRRSIVGSEEDIVRKMNSQKDLWDKNIEHVIVDIEKDNLAPEHMREFIKKYPNFYYN